MNNILEIDSDKNINIQNNDNISNNINKSECDNEGIPILSQLEISSYSIEDYYKANYPEYKIIRFRNHIFIKMGRLITFNFDKNNNYIPKLSIGPHWYLTIILLIIILSLAMILYYTIFNNMNSIKKIIFFYLYII